MTPIERLPGLTKQPRAGCFGESGFRRQRRNLIGVARRVRNVHDGSYSPDHGRYCGCPGALFRFLQRVPRCGECRGDDHRHGRHVAGNGADHRRDLRIHRAFSLRYGRGQDDRQEYHRHVGLRSERHGPLRRSDHRRADRRHRLEPDHLVVRPALEFVPCPDRGVDRPGAHRLRPGQDHLERGDVRIRIADPLPADRHVFRLAVPEDHAVHRGKAARDTPCE